MLQHSLPWLTTRFLWSFSRNWASPSPQNTLIPPSPPLFLCGMLSLAPLLVLVYILGRVLVTSKRKRIWLIYVKYSLLVSYQIPVETEKSTLENWHELRKDSKPRSHHMNSLARMVILGTRWNISRFALIVRLMSLSPCFGHQKRREKLLSLLSFWRYWWTLFPARFVQSSKYILGEWVTVMTIMWSFSTILCPCVSGIKLIHR